MHRTSIYFLINFNPSSISNTITLITKYNRMSNLLFFNSLNFPLLLIIVHKKIDENFHVGLHIFFLASFPFLLFPLILNLLNEKFISKNKSCIHKLCNSNF